MNKRNKRGGWLSALALCLTLTLVGGTGCETKENDDELLFALGAVVLSQLQITGSYNYFNGDATYAGGCGGFCSSGTTKVGEYSFVNPNYLHLCQNTTDCGTASTTRASIVEYDNNKQILYIQFDSTHPFTPNRFSYVKWTISGGATYICPDVSGVGSQTTLALAKDSNSDGAEDYVAEVNASNLNAGCSSFNLFWSRLERK